MREILAGGGEAMVRNAESIDGLSDDQVVKMFRTARDADYQEIAQQAKTLTARLPASEKKTQSAIAGRTEILMQIQRLKRRLGETARPASGGLGPWEGMYPEKFQPRLGRLLKKAMWMSFRRPAFSAG